MQTGETFTHEHENPRAALSCAYCGQLITADDDAHRVSRREPAHTECAFAASDAFFFFAFDVESERENDTSKE